ncbi:hypothetical protein J4430_02885 [Candidatus Woesearchaeota archaeon]|nr:hypothetical protein [Candidatus Woesearchaeota archaeon]
MSLKINEKTENPLFKRKEILIEAQVKGAIPKKEELKKEIASLLGCTEDTIIIKRINSKFGENKITANLHQYETPEALKETEEIKKRKKEKKK